jgi:hypothetical protein
MWRQVRIQSSLLGLAVEMGRVATLDFTERSMYGSRLVDEIVAISRRCAGPFSTA